MATIHTADAPTVAKWLEDNEAVLIDVREPAEYRAEHIAQAQNLPLSLVTLSSVHLPEHKGKKLVVQCLSGRRAQMACEKLMAENPPFDVWNLEGGINGWKEAKLPIRTSGAKMLPLDRQVQVTVGGMILLGFVLYGAGVQAGLLLPLMAGLGLTNAGVTGWCGMAKLLARMPWNK